MGVSLETALIGQTAGEHNDNENLADPAAEKVKQKENETVTLKIYH